MATSGDPIAAVVPHFAARRLLMQGSGLNDDPARKATPASVCKLIERMGYVQVDTINIVERAHHHILMSRFEGFERRMLWKLLEKDRSLFEHWTHDASVLPVGVMEYWPHRYERSARRIKANAWWNERMGGPKANRILREVLKRIREEGPLMSKDFEHKKEGSGPWWGWKPQKAALEFLWHTGKLSVSKRINFHKVYDLTERVFPQQHDNGKKKPTRRMLIDWACRSALDRLGTASPAEIREFWQIVNLDETRGWCNAQAAKGEITRVESESADGSKSRAQFALNDWKERLCKLPGAPSQMRLLSPFDPAIRDRKRLLRLFNFDYRFEVFVPEAKRKYGYYVMPLLEGDRLVGRLDPKFHRDEGTLKIRKVWWESGIRLTKLRSAALERALDVFANQIGADGWTLPRKKAQG